MLKCGSTFAPEARDSSKEMVNHDRDMLTVTELEPSKAASHPSTQTLIFISICLDELKMGIVHLYYSLLTFFWHAMLTENTDF